MVKKDTIFDYLTQVMVIWGIAMLSLCLFCTLFGGSGKEYSSIFRLGNAGISIATAMEFLGLAVLLSGFRWICFTDNLLKKSGMLVRMILMFACVVLAVGIFAALFQWFPVNQMKPWVMFFLCFCVCACISVVVSAQKEKSDNKKMQEALEDLKAKELQ